MLIFSKTKLTQHSPALIAGAGSALAYVYLAYHSQHYGDATLFHLLTVSGICAGLCFALWAYHHYTMQALSIPIMLGFALLFRIIGLSAFPVLEDDIYRYLWDARVTMVSGSPYNIAPFDFFSAPMNERFETIIGLINYPEISTVYGPVAQWAFALGYLIAPGEVWPLQLIFAMADIGIILVLLRLSQPHWVLLYAWCPLIIKEFAFTAHPDVLGAFFLVLAVWCYQRQRSAMVGMLLALALGVKVFALIAVPFLLGVPWLDRIFNKLTWFKSDQITGKTQWLGWLTFITTALVIALPFCNSEVSLIDVWLPIGLRSMGSDWLFNAPLYLLFSLFISLSTVKTVLLIGLAIGSAGYLLYALKHWPLTQPRLDLLFAALFLCLPALNPWYLVWLLPFAVLRPSVWAWVASATLLLAYASGINLAEHQSSSNVGLTLEPYQIPNWIVAIEFGAIALAAVVGIWQCSQNTLESEFKTKP